MSQGGNADAGLDPSIGIVAVARAVKTRGLSGEIAADLLTDFPERFTNIKQLIAVSPAGKRALLILESFWLHRERIVLKFVGYDTVEAAEELVGYELAVPEADCVQLAEDEFYDWQLTGCMVETVGGVTIGSVRKVWHTGGIPVLVIEDAEEKRDHLVPLAETICVEINTACKRIRIDPPEGLLEF